MPRQPPSSPRLWFYKLVACIMTWIPYALVNAYSSPGFTTSSFAQVNAQTHCYKATSSFVASPFTTSCTKLTFPFSQQELNTTPRSFLTMRVSRKRSKTASIKGSSISTLNYQRQRQAGRRGTKRFIDPNKVFVGNLPYDVDSKELQSWLEGLGLGPQLLSCKVISDWKTKQSKGYGFIQFLDPIYASSAMSLLTGKSLKGRPLRFLQGKYKPEDPVLFVKDKSSGDGGNNRKKEDLSEEDLVIARSIDLQDDESLVETKLDDTEEEAEEDEEEEEEEINAAEILMDPTYEDDILFADEDYEDLNDEDIPFEHEVDLELNENKENDDAENQPLKNRAKRREEARRNKKRRKPGKGFGVVGP